MAEWHLWQSVIEIGTILGAALGFGITQGKLRQKVTDMNRKLDGDIAKRLGEHDSELAFHSATFVAHEGLFNVMDNKLDNLKEGQADIKRVAEKIADKLDQHCAGDRG